MIGELVPRASLRDADVRDMYRLFTAHFDGVGESTFHDDLAQKQWVIRIREGDALRGFTSLRLLGADARGAPDVLYSGDTIVAPEARGSSVLARTWIESVRRLAQHHGVAHLNWLLLVSGFRTYRLLPVYWREFHPNYQREPPAAVRERIDALAAAAFGSSYDARAGVVRFDRPQVLRPQFRDIPPGRLADPHVAFFAARNPGYVRGDELVCWTRLTADNLTPAGARMWHAADARSTHALSG